MSKVSSQDKLIIPSLVEFGQRLLGPQLLLEPRYVEDLDGVVIDTLAHRPANATTHQYSKKFRTELQAPRSVIRETCLSHLISRLSSAKDFSKEDEDLEEFAGGVAVAAVFPVVPATMP